MRTVLAVFLGVVCAFAAGSGWADAPGPVVYLGAWLGFPAQNHLSWMNPSDSSFAGTMIRYSTTGFPASPSDGTLLCDRAAAPGSYDSFQHPGNPNATYYYAAFAHDGEDHFAAGVNKRLDPYLTIVQLLGRVDGSVVTAQGVVTAAFPDWFYVEEPNRAQGIYVYKAMHFAAPGDVVRAKGVLQTSYLGERMVQASEVSTISHQPEVLPIAMPASAVTGGEWVASPFYVKHGATGATGPNRVGSLVQSTGRVSANGPGYFYVDDCTGWVDYLGGHGTRVDYDATPPDVGSYVTVTGISGLFWGHDPSEFFIGVIRALPGANSVIPASVMTTQITLYPGENWFSLPRAPLDPNPAVLFGGTSLIDGKLTKLTRPTCEEVTYSAGSPSAFGNLALGEGYRINITDGQTHTITYQGMHVADEKLWDFWVNPPPQGEFWFGSPYDRPVFWGNALVTDGFEMLTISDAISAGWFDTEFTGWDPITQQEFTLDPEGLAGTPWLVPGTMYKATTLAPDLGLLLSGDGIWKEPTSGNWSDPARWLNGQVPQPDSKVFIVTPGNYTVTVDNDFSAKALTLGDIAGANDEKVVVDSGNTLSIQQDAGIASGGELMVNDGLVDVSGGLINYGTLSFVASAGAPGPLVSVTGPLVSTGGGSIEAHYRGVPAVTPISVGGVLHPSGTMKIVFDSPYTIASPTSFPLMQSSAGIEGDFDSTKKTFPTVPGLAWGTQKRQESSVMVYRVNSALPLGLGGVSGSQDGSVVCVPGRVYASGGALGTGVFYMTVTDRIAGIRVESDSSPQVGREVEVIGTLGKTPDNERVLRGSPIGPGTMQTPPDPLFLQNKYVGGARNGYNQGSVPDGLFGTMNTVGMYVAASGRVSGSGGGQFWIDDGSGSLVLVKAEGLALPDDGSFARVQGPCGLTLDSGSNAATIRPTSAEDITRY